MDLSLPLAIWLVAAALTSALVPLSRVIATKAGALDYPGHRKIHAQPMPRMGGIAVFASFTTLVLGGFLFLPIMLETPWVSTSLRSAVGPLSGAGDVQGRLIALLLGATTVFGVGLLDDLLGERFPVWLKALGQLLGALILVMGGGVTTSFLPYEWMNVVVTLLWLVGITNAFNLLDNMDGLSAGVALVACGILFVNACLRGEYFIALIFAAFMGSLAGFLFFNFKPASVFLGDCGSLFIGFMMGALTLLERYVSHSSSSLFPILMPVVVLAVPIVDTATVIAIRLYERRPIYVGDSRHLSHQLVALGFSQRSAVLIIYAVTACLGLGAFSLVDATLAQSLSILFQVVGFVGLMLTLMFGVPRLQPALARQPANLVSVREPRPPMAKSRPGRVVHATG
jgi:UDP-GlcNAc:undecaprenyl-phosphate GlcNAc-1-phosphate transferase